MLPKAVEFLRAVRAMLLEVGMAWTPVLFLVQLLEGGENGMRETSGDVIHDAAHDMIHVFVHLVAERHRVMDLLRVNVRPVNHLRRRATEQRHRGSCFVYNDFENHD